MYMRYERQRVGNEKLVSATKDRQSTSEDAYGEASLADGAG